MAKTKKELVTVTVTIRLSQDEKDLFEERAQSLGSTISQRARFLIQKDLNGEQHKTTTQEGEKQDV